MPDSSQILQDALEAIDKLGDLSDDVIQTNRRLVKAVLKKLKSAAEKPGLCVLDALETSRTKIEAYTKKPVHQAVARPIDWQDVDIRVFDIGFATKKQSLLTKFRKGLGERSLASQFHQWEIRRFGRSRLDELQEDIGRQDRCDGHIPEFITSQHLPDILLVVKGIQHGTKLLLFERLTETPCTSALLFFCFTQFRAVNYPDLHKLRDKFRATEWIREFCKEIEHWFGQCMNAYSGETKRKRHDGTTEPEVSLYNSKRAKIATLGRTAPEVFVPFEHEMLRTRDRTTAEPESGGRAAFQPGGNAAAQGQLDQATSCQSLAGLPAWDAEVVPDGANSSCAGVPDLLSPFDINWDYSSLLSDPPLFMTDSALLEAV